MLNILVELDKFNNVVFHDDTHSYYIGDKTLTSTTTLIKQFVKPFDTEGHSQRYALKNGLSVEEVLAEWDFKRESSASKGTELHKYAELKFASKAYNPSEEDLPLKLREMADKFHSDSIGRLIPIRSELVIGDTELLIGGMIDQLFYNVKADEIQIWDYKTNKEINTYSKYKSKMTNGLNHLQECEYNTYSLQLAIYKKIIERNTGLKLGDSYICWINENNETYKTFKMANMTNEVDFIFNQKLGA